MQAVYVCIDNAHKNTLSEDHIYVIWKLLTEIFFRKNLPESISNTINSKQCAKTKIIMEDYNI